MPETTALAIGFGVVIFYLVVLGLAIASYVLQSLSLYGIAKKRDIKCAWLAWVPVAINWIIGSVVDDFDSQNGHKRKWRVTLITLSVIVLVGLIAIYAVAIAMAVAMAMSGQMYDPSVYDPMVTKFVGFGIVMYVFFFAITFAVVLLQAISYICMFKIFEFIVPKKAVKYLILSFIVPLAYPICLLKCKDICPEKQVHVTPSVPAEAEEPAVLEEKSAETDEDKGE
ncbi:MAG: hypothetical protein E7635_00035 [Ruminococcaceae bacterium]|nr:hypothetical protein [Oscillospiraceae bacterium]